jgi:hypothetical protein
VCGVPADGRLSSMSTSKGRVMARCGCFNPTGSRIGAELLRNIAKAHDIPTLGERASESLVRLQNRSV